VLGTPWAAVAGVGFAIVSAMLLSALHAWLSITIKADQIISGTVINILALGGTAFFNQLLVSTTGLSGTDRLPSLKIAPEIAQIPVVGPIIAGLFAQGPIAMSLFFFVIGLHLLLFRSRWGLRTRAVGEHPKAADTVGIDVYLVRYRNVILGGIFAGLGGAFLTLEQFNSFQDNMTGGVGFIGLAAMIFGRWTPLGAYGAALLFGAVQSMQLAVRISPPAGDLGQAVAGVPPQFFGMAPYIFTIIVLAGFVGRAVAPAADGIPYDKESRG
jgi:simple sugar transport system permease protein